MRSKALECGGRDCGDATLTKRQEKTIEALFLSPREAAASVLAALQTVRSSGEVVFPAYFVNGALANHRASRLLRVVEDGSSSSPLQASARACFEDLVSSLPSSLRYTISDRLLLAATQAEAEAGMEAEVEEVQGERGRRDCGNERKRSERVG